jgi:sialate O-acetylesterase
MNRKLTDAVRVCTFVLSLVMDIGKVYANVAVPALIADSMVLQQQSDVALWGWADPGEKIQVSNSWNSSSATTIADARGNWQVRIRTAAAGGPFKLIIKGSNTIVVNDVFLGEVWLCSGQSNMNFPLGKGENWRTGVFNYEAEVAKANYPLIRLFTVKQEVGNEPQKTVNGQWNTCTPGVAAKFSAVAYYFARELREKTGFPIGLIHSSWGGTPAESWVRKEVLDADADLEQVMNRYNGAITGYPAAQNEYEREFARWKAESDSITQNGGKAKHPPMKPANPVTDSKSPTKLYNAMIHPLIPYTIKGVIWYQGESNSDRAYQYRKLFPALIKSWREEWKADFPFYFVQIAPEYQQNPEIREAQLLTYKAVHKTGMAVITDYGDSLNIHPRNKEAVGHRLALWALARDYGRQDIICSGPVYHSMKIKGRKVVIKFDDANGGLVAKDGSLKEFTIAGSNKTFVPANATIEGNTIVVWSDVVEKPVAVRFGWRNFPHAELYNKAGLPASPFRTDDWPAQTAGKN